MTSQAEMHRFYLDRFDAKLERKDYRPFCRQDDKCFVHNPDGVPVPNQNVDHTFCAKSYTFQEA